MDFTCKAQYTGIGQFVRCLENKPSKCPFALPLGSTFFCKSPHWANFYSKQDKSVQEYLTIQDKVDEEKKVS